jgi:hypothetical protein
VAVALAVVAALLGVPRAALLAQLPGLPVLQNAYSNPGITLGVNAGFASDAKSYAFAASWGPGSGSFVFSGGVGALSPDSGSAVTAFGGRVAFAVPWLRRLGDLGGAVFVGAGGATRSRVSTLSVPAGVAIGWRRAFGARGISVYAAPFYGWTRVSDGGSASAGLFRVSAGVDVTVMPKLGVTLGVESGATAKDGDPGPTGTVFGAGVSYAFR